MRRTLKPNKNLLKLACLTLGFCVFAGIAQAQSVSGSVTDSETGEALPGVNIVVQGTQTGTATGSDGQYEMAVPSLEATLVFSYVGYTEQIIAIDGRASIDVEMVTQQLGEELVVVGYGTQRRSDVTGSIGSVSSEDFNRGQTSTPEQLLQGKVAGVNVTASGGQPGSPQKVTIRGPGTVRSGSGPLYVIDGVAIDNNAATSSAGESFGVGSASATNPLSFLNSEDIESISVLKDASATAIYGSRGSEGVILITTKSGVRGQSELNYQGSVTSSRIANRIDMLSPDEFADFHNTHGDPSVVNDSRTVWFDEILEDGLANNHSLSFSNGTESSDFLGSMNYSDQQGIMIGSKLESVGGRLRGNQRFLDNHLKLGVNLMANRTRTDFAPIADSPSTNGGDMITNALTQNPTNPVRNADGSLFPITQEGFNPLRGPEILTNFSNVTRVLGNFNAEMEFMEGLVYRGNLAVDNSHGATTSQVTAHGINRISNPQGKLVDANVENTTFQTESTLNYMTSLRGAHNFDLLAGYSWQTFTRQGKTFSVDNFTTTEIDAYRNPGIGSELSISENQPTGYHQQNQLQSYFGRTNYNYMNRYFLTATVRADGSSRFGGSNRYGIFPSFSGAWQLNDEGFFNVDAISSLRLRLGWGQSGNQDIPNGITQQRITVSSGSGAGYVLAPGIVTPGITFVRTQNEDIKWEVSTQTNAGIDFGFLGDALSGTIDVFHKVSSDILFEQTTGVDPINPTNSFWNNYDMEIINQGVEAALNFRKQIGNEFNFDLGGNIAFLDNEVQNMPVQVIRTGGLTGRGLSGETVQAYKDGLPFGAFYLYEFAGLNEDGANTFIDASGNVTTDVTSEDLKYAGGALPDVTYGISTFFGYRNFDLSFNFNGVSGNKIYWNDHNGLHNMAQLYAGNNIARVGFDPNESATNSATASTRFLYDGSFFRLNNATLGYQINAANLPIRGLRLAVTGQNLFTITNYPGFDPEVDMPRAVGGFQSLGIDSSRYPTARSITFSINVNI
ncbi:MAG: SusC/RagA family TonB-linked outer membrane protein [Balneolales bacterium]